MKDTTGRTYKVAVIYLHDGEEPLAHLRVFYTHYEDDVDLETMGEEEVTLWASNNGYGIDELYWEWADE